MNNHFDKKVYRFNEVRENYPSIRKRKEKARNNNSINGSLYRIINIKKNHFSRIGSGNNKKYLSMFKPKDLRDKIGENPVCYLTGDKINLEDSQQWSLDHIIPRSRGGDNSLDNCGITTTMANQMKSYQSVEELLIMCEKILTNNGYKVYKIGD